MSDSQIIEGLEVQLPSGARQPVLTPGEQAYVQERLARYEDSLALTNISDQQDLDRVLIFELLIARIGAWLGSGLDYDGNAVDERVLNTQLNEHSRELRQLKKNLGIDRVARERQSGAGSVHERWSNILARAKAFSVMRNEQAAKAVDLANELMSLVGTHDRATDREREELHVTSEDILDWVRTVFSVEFTEIDRVFRQDGPEAQKTWIRSLQA